MNSIHVPLIMDDGTTKWVTITDRVKMEKLFIENNKNFFAQAEVISPTIASLVNILGNGMSESCNKILDGTYEIPKILPLLVQKYLKNMKRDNNIPQELNPTIPVSEIKKASKNGKNKH